MADKSSSDKLHATVEQLTQCVMQQAKQLEMLTSLMAKREPVGDNRPELTIESLANTIERFRYDPGNGLTFDSWFARFEDVFVADTQSLDDSGRVRLLLHRLDSVAHERYTNFILPLTPKERTFRETVETLRQLFAQPESQFCLRWKCFQMTKKETEDFAAYAANVNKLCEDFKLRDMSVDQFKCLIFILGLKSGKDADIRTRLHNKLEQDGVENMTLSSLVTEAMRLVNLKHDTKLGAHSAVTPVLQVKKTGKRKDKPKKDEPVLKYPCHKCGAMHLMKDCSYNSHVCGKCMKTGHKEGYCSVGQNANAPAAPARQCVVKVDDDGQPLVVNNVRDSKRKYMDVMINGRSIVMQLDTAADVTIITRRVWEDIGCPPLNLVFKTPVDAQNNELPICGSVYVQVEFNGVIRSGDCLVSDTDACLFGIKWINLFGLWDLAPSTYCRAISAEKPPGFDEVTTKESLKFEFADVFNTSLGCCSIGTAKLTLIPDAKPVFIRKREVPFLIKERVGEELDRLQQSGIISPIAHSDYAAPIVIVKKPNGGLRICADYSTGLNRNLLAHEYPIPVPDDIFATLSNCCVFSTVDLSDAYHQILVDEESSKLMAINTHRGLYTFNRLCPGVKPAAGIFQQMMDKIFNGMENVVTYFDDIMVATSDWPTHMEVLREVFMRLRKFNVRARWEKCHLFQERLRFLGIIIDREGLRPDKSKIEAIVNMPPPSNLAEARSLMGAIGFYLKFIKSMSSLRHPIDKLFRKDAEFEWTKECQSAFDRFKEILSSDLMLVHYNPNVDICVAADASQNGIGAVAYHAYPDGSMKAFYHVSRRLTETEQRYSQIEKEALAIVFGVTKFRKYIWGRKFKLFTDHRPLLAIFNPNSGIPRHTANRLQRWAEHLLSYDFEINFTRTEDFGHADILSRLIADRPMEECVVAAVQQEEELNDQFSSSCDARFPVTFRQIGIATKADRDLAELRKFMENGWPPSPKAILSGEVKFFFNCKDALSLINDCIIFRDRTLIPHRYRNQILHSLHETHPGMTRMKALARSYVYWPGLDNDIKDLVHQCAPCQEVAKAPIKATLSSWPLPMKPWERVHADYAGPIHDKWYLVLVDAYSKWPEVFQVTSTTTSVTIDKIMECCGRLGFMSTLVTDNGPQFCSGEFEEFCSLNNINHMRTAPYHPQSNGLAERFVATLKGALAKNQNNSTSTIAKFLMNYRATPSDYTPNCLSPAELLFGRRINLPLAAVLPPSPVGFERNISMEDAFNKKHGAIERHFAVGERVLTRIAPKSKWIEGEVIERIGTSMYNIYGNGKLVRAHINQMKPCYSNLELDLLVDDKPSTTEKTSVNIRTRRNWRAVTRASPPKLRQRPPRN